MEIEKEVLATIENYTIYKQLNNPYGNGYVLYRDDDKFIGAFDTLKILFEDYYNNY